MSILGSSFSSSLISGVAVGDGGGLDVNGLMFSVLGLADVTRGIGGRESASFLSSRFSSLFTGVAVEVSGAAFNEDDSGGLYQGDRVSPETRYFVSIKFSPLSRSQVSSSNC